MNIYSLTKCLKNIVIFVNVRKVSQFYGENCNSLCITASTLISRRTLNVGSLIGNAAKAITETNLAEQTDCASVTRTKERKRPLRKKQLPKESNKKTLQVVAFCTAEEYQLSKLGVALKEQNVYEILDIADEIEDAICIRSKYETDADPKETFLFGCGTVVFWNVPMLERNAILNFIKPFERKRVAKSLVEEEKEDLDYEYIETKTRLNKGTILLQNENSETILEKYTVSNVLSLSVQLAIWESLLENYVDSIKGITQDISLENRVKLTRNEVFMKTGELFDLRHCINLSSDLLDTPDFYWDRERLERLFQSMCSLFNITKRTKVMNEKLNHCCELMELLSAHLNDKHHVRLEWMIIILIMVEVLFETVAHFQK